jgi:hypothetical protein
LTLFGLCQWAMPIAVSPDQKFGFRIEKLAFWVASKWSLDQFCRGFFFLKINSANWFCQNNRGSQGDNEKGMGQGCWGGVGGGGLNHCSHVGPHLGTLVPMGTKMSFLVPIWSQFIFKVPIFSISDLRTRQKSVQPLSNVNHEITCGNKN